MNRVKHSVFIIISLLFICSGVVAQEQHQHGDGDKTKHQESASEGHQHGQQEQHQQNAGGGHQHGQGGNHSPEQRAEIDHMHHQLDDDQKPYKEQEARALKELNEMTIREDVKLDAVYAKIDELMAAKNQIMSIRYEHLIEIRKILTDEQKVRYEERLLKRSEVR